MRSIVSFLMVLLTISLFAQKGFKNPAAAYVQAMGYEFKTNADANGNEFGVALLPNGKEVNAWDLFRGKVAPEYSYCAKKGYLVKTKTINQNGFSSECAVCYSGSELKSSVEIPMADLMQQNGDLGELSIGKNPEVQAIEEAKINPGFKSAAALPTTFDWRSYNGHSYIGPIRNQGDCGSCYSFGAAATAEGVYNYATGKYDSNCADFAEAYIAFCLGQMSAYSSHFSGCDGADYSYSELQALVDIGICAESYFPYSESASSCPSAATNAPKTQFANWYRVSCSDISAIKTAIMTYGVVDAAVYADGAFQNYTNGIFSNSSTSCTGSPCENTTTNHAIALVGWGHDATYGDYWILRNSWGSSWGESGYMRIAATSARVACSVAYLTYSNVNVPVTGVSLSLSSLSLNIGQTSTLLATISPSNATNKNVTWTSSNTAVATVSSTGAVTGVGAGAATITVTTQDGSYKATCAVNVSTTVTYCTSKGSNATYEWIKGVTIGSFTNSSASNSGYGDFTGVTAPLNTNNTYSISLVPGFSSSNYNEYWKIWIDFNHNGTLDDAGELVFDQGGYSSSTVTGSITIPSTETTGTTRMRVSMKYISSSSASGPTACETFSYGEVEDYTVNISAGSIVVPAVPSSLAVSNITTTSATLSWGAVSNATGYNVRYKKVSDSAWASTSTTSTSLSISSLTSNMLYEFQVSATNSAGSSAYSSSTNFTTLSASVTYCSAKGGVSDEWIAQVQLGSINNSTGANGGYGNFTSLSTTIARGSSQTIYFKAGYKSSVYSENWKVWIDYNHDGDFADSGEEVVSGSTSSASLYTASFTVPSTATVGSTRMRVGMVWSSTPTSCGTFSYGEFEDYTVNITATVSKAELPRIIANAEALNTQISEFAFDVHPNPATSELTIKSEGISNINGIKITNTQGKVVIKLSNPKGGNVVDISRLPDGTYIITIDTERGKFEKLFIKQE